MTLRDHTRAILDTLDGIGVEPAHIVCRRLPDSIDADVSFASCADYEAACKAWKVKPDPGRLHGRGWSRQRETLAGTLFLAHRCMPHLPCWRQP